MNMHTPWQFQNDSSSKMRRDLHQKQKEIANLIAGWNKPMQVEIWGILLL